MNLLGKNEIEMVFGAQLDCLSVTNIPMKSSCISQGKTGNGFYLTVTSNNTVAEASCGDWPTGMMTYGSILNCRRGESIKVTCSQVSLDSCKVRVGWWGG